MKHDSPGIREVVLVMGMTGWGKSWWTKVYSKQFPRRVVYDPSATFPVQEYISADEVVKVVLDKEKKSWNVGFTDPDDIPQVASSLFAVGRNFFIVEECATVFEKGLARLPEWGKHHVFYGRHQSCSILLIAQRPTYIPIDFRSQANRVVTFCQHEGADMDWLQDFYGKERMDRMLTLPKFHCFDYHDGVVYEYSIHEKVKQEFGVTLDSRIQSEYPTFV